MKLRMLSLALPALWLSSSLAADAAKPLFTLQQLAPGVWAAISVPKSGTGGNAGFVVGSDGVAVIDAFQTTAAAQALLDAIRKTTDKPVRFVIDTHYHLDHVGGNGVFAQAGAVVMAEHNVAAWERTENLKFFGASPKPEEKAMVESLTLPTLTYKDGVVLSLGDRKLVVKVVQGHTGGDSAVIVPDAKVVFTGDLFWDHDLPNLIDADTLQQIATNDDFVKDHPDATFVPGHGVPGKKADVMAFRDYIMALRAAVAGARSAGKTGQGLVDQVLPGLKKQYGDWGYFDYFSLPNIKDTESELAGTKKRPVPVD